MVDGYRRTGERGYVLCRVQHDMHDMHDMRGGQLISTVGPDCAVKCNLINIYKHTHMVFVISGIDPPLGGSMRVA